MSARPAVDVVIPFAGPTPSLAGLLARVGRLERGPEDTVTVVDNRPRDDRPAPPEGVGLTVAATRRSSYHARNAGARNGTAPWLLFLDADVDPRPDLLDRLFDPPPRTTTAILAGGVRDAPGPGAAARYARLKGAMSQDVTLGHGRWAFAQTANCAVRRCAFTAAGGFQEVRSGGDADLCFRLAALGWGLERRDHAAVEHGGRSSVARLLGQRLRHGAGVAWLGREHPGALPPRTLHGAAWWGARRAADGLRALRRGDRDAALVALLDGPTLLAFELGRRLPNVPR